MSQPKRTINKALRDVLAFNAEHPIKQADLVNISIGFLGRVTIQLEPREFVRLFQKLRVSKSTLDANVSKQGNLHAEFEFRQIEFSCVVLRDSPEFDLLTSGDRIGQDVPKISQSNCQLLLD